MQIKNVQITSSDVWIMQTIIHCTYINSFATLKDIITVGDAINHAIFTPGELQSGIIKYLNLELITIMNKSIVLTEKAKDEFGKVIERKLSLNKEQERISTLLKAKKWEPNEVLPKYDTTKLQDFYTEKEFIETCQEYQKEASKFINKIIESRKT